MANKQNDYPKTPDKNETTNHRWTEKALRFTKGRRLARQFPKSQHNGMPGGGVPFQTDWSDQGSARVLLGGRGKKNGCNSVEKGD